MKKIFLLFFILLLYNFKTNSLFAQATCKEEIEFSWTFKGYENFRNAQNLKLEIIRIKQL